MLKNIIISLILLLSTNAYTQETQHLTPKQEQMVKKIQPAFIAVCGVINQLLEKQGRAAVKLVDKDYNKKTQQLSRSFQVLLYCLQEYYKNKGDEVQIYRLDKDVAGIVVVDNTTHM